MDVGNLPNLVTNTTSENAYAQESCLEDDGIEFESLHVLSIASDYQSTDLSLLLPCDGMQVDNQLSILHLLKAYGEALEMEITELADAITMRLKEKSCPTGSIWQRLSYYFIQALDEQVKSPLREEAGMNYEIAFNVFYQIFPYGRFAHFTANSVILEAIPKNAEIVHIVDFEIGNGIQWPPVIEALAMQDAKFLRLTSIKWEEEGNYEYTKLLLYEHGRNFGLRLKVEEMDLESFASEMKETKESGEGTEFLAFNCMVGLPHMDKRISVKSVIKFLKVAKDAINLNCNNGGGIITFGDGIGWGKGIRGWNRNGYISIFEGQLAQFKILLQSIETHFPHHLKEARIAIECLFLVPYISSLIDIQMWKHISREIRTLSELGLEPWRMRIENLMEAKELVREEESFYWVSFEGVKHNQMVLGYMETPVTKVSSWR
ncbi:hypothetical protein JCGZ_17380 [Jatropha curcas]|uniref:GRAS45 protein n=1 Tax=Jatropha curcas TaxID=180498 RepID=A0A067LEZ0_JATCU|nr:protein NODULATION SIGNALING PATHWAY 2 [Jatropha curcas]AMR43764.1 GRAS45 protein [Jatropha curcas]KDP45773.1 hypothetical protein JCGZ_17380 [Jatropha curcas]